MNLELINLNQPSKTPLRKGRLDLEAWGLRSSVGDLQAGWRWSEQVAPTVGTASCQVGHVGLVLSGQAVARMDDETQHLM